MFDRLSAGHSALRRYTADTVSIRLGSIRLGSTRPGTDSDADTANGAADRRA